jgi:hypothetical protein
MKKLLSLLFLLACCTAPCQAQFGALGGLLKGAKAANDIRKTRKNAQEALGNRKVKDVIDTTSVNFRKARAELQQSLDNDPEYQKLLELQNDSVAARKYYEEKYGGELPKPDLDSKEYKEAHAKTVKMSEAFEDPVLKKAMEEKRSLTLAEATYLNDKYGTSFEGEGMEAYNDSIGIFAHLNGKLKPMSITKSTKMTEERPVPDLGQNEIKQYVQDFIAVLKKPLADREIIDSVQNYMIYNGRHSDYQFKGTARFTIYSNPETNIGNLTVNDVQLRKAGDFMEPIDPKNIFVFKVHKGIDCRFMEYMYSKITYKQSELADYVSKRLVDDGYIDANINKKISDDQLFRAMDKLEFQFKVEKLLKLYQNKDKYLFTNTIPEAKDVRITSKSRKIAHVTALEVAIDAEPGEYAFIIRNPEVEKDLKTENFDFSILLQGAFFFTVK